MVLVNSVVAAVDLGGGRGAKLGLFALVGSSTALRSDALLWQGLLPVEEYGQRADELAAQLHDKIQAGLKTLDGHKLAAFGIASTGIFMSDGSYQSCSQFSFLNRQNLPALLSKLCGVPGKIDNDAKAGGLAEWNLARGELLYWVLGGGWGGSWIGRDGTIRFNSLDWDGQEGSLHCVSEPGYATHVPHVELEALFRAEGISYEKFQQRTRRELAAPLLIPPFKDERLARAEMFISGPSRVRMFQAARATELEKNPACEKNWPLSAAERAGLEMQAEAGAVMSKLSAAGVAAALRADRLFGRALGYCGALVAGRAIKDGMARDAQVFLAGGPAGALPYFGPAAAQEAAARGVPLKLTRSAVEVNGENPNLRGAAVLATRAF